MLLISHVLHISPMRGASANLGNVDKHVMVIAMTTPTAPTPTLRLLQLVLGSEATQVVHKVWLQRHGWSLGCLAGAPNPPAWFQYLCIFREVGGWGFIQMHACWYARDFLLAFARNSMVNWHPQIWAHGTMNFDFVGKYVCIDVVYIYNLDIKYTYICIYIHPILGQTNIKSTAHDMVPSSRLYHREASIIYSWHKCSFPPHSRS